MVRIIAPVLALVFGGLLAAAEPSGAVPDAAGRARIAERIVWWEARSVAIPERFRSSVERIDRYARCYLRAYDDLVTGRAVQRLADQGRLTTEDAAERYRPPAAGAVYPVELPGVQTRAIGTGVTVPAGGSVRLGGVTGGGVSRVGSLGGSGTSAAYGAGQGSVSVEVIELE